MRTSFSIAPCTTWGTRLPCTRRGAGRITDFEETILSRYGKERQKSWAFMTSSAPSLTVEDLVIITFVIRSFRGPFSFVMFASDLLLQGGISHVDQPDEKAAEVGEMGDAPACPTNGREEFDQAEDDHHIFCRNGEEKINIDEQL